jgi:F-type H+-transporting ATPase subunit b
MHTAVFAQSIQLFPDGTIFIHIALILLMIWVLNRTFFRPINRVIANREKFRNVEGGEAGSIAREADEKEAAYNRELLSARSDAYSYLEDQHAKLVKAREKKLAETRAEAEQKTAAERAEIERQTAEARAAIGADAEKLADQIAATVLKG